MTHLHEQGPREELVTELRDRAEGWHHMAKDTLRDACLNAADQLEMGATEATAGPTTWRVTEG